jgi:hypothetical protein
MRPATRLPDDLDRAVFPRRAATLPAAGRLGHSAAKLRFNTSIKLMMLSADGMAILSHRGISACFFSSFSINTVR